jgi:hypothetical protein
MSKQSMPQKSKQNRVANKPVSQQTANQTQAPSKPLQNKSVANQAQVPSKSSQNKPVANQAQSPSKPTSRYTQKQIRQEEQRRAARRTTITVISVIAAVLLVTTVAVYFLVFAPGTTTQSEAVYNPAYPPVDGIYCDQLEQTAFHVHAHLSIYINGQLMVAPANVGIADPNGQGSCFYWLHVHNPDGIIHMEAPVGHSFTLGNFFDIWSNEFQSLNYPSQLDVNAGWTAYVNGKLYNGDFHSIPLNAHSLITLMYNSPNAKPDTTYNWGTL